MLATIRNKIRALIEDLSKSGFEVFTKTSANIFTIAQENITLTKVLINGVETSDYTFDINTNKIEITASGFAEGDIVETDYSYYKYSDTELDEFIRASLVWISVYSDDDKDYELEAESSGEEVISPTPNNRTTDLIALISSILIKPDYTSYKLPNVTVIYNGKMPKEDRIEKLIGKFNMGLGVNDIIEFDIYY